MSLPTPVIVPVADIPAASLPTSVALDGSGSLPASGATSIVGWEWVLHSKPPGSAAFLNNPTTVNPTLENIDTVGSYLVSLKVTDDLGGVSFSGIEPVQSGSAPYGFTFPTAGSMISVRVLTPNADLVKVAYGERAWLGRGLWELVDAVDDLRGDLDGLLGSGFSGDVYTDNIYELTPANDIHVHHPVRVNTIKPRTGTTVGVDGRLDVTSLIYTPSQVTAQTRVVTPEVRSPAGLDLHALAGPAVLEGHAGVTVTATTTGLDLHSLAGPAVLEGHTAVTVTATTGPASVLGDGVAVNGHSENVDIDGANIYFNTHTIDYNHRTQYFQGGDVNTTSGGVLLPVGAGDLMWDANRWGGYNSNSSVLEFDFAVVMNGTFFTGNNLAFSPVVILDVTGTPEEIEVPGVSFVLPKTTYSGAVVRVSGLLLAGNVASTIIRGVTYASLALGAGAVGDHRAGISAAATGGRSMYSSFQVRLKVTCDDDSMLFRSECGIVRMVR